MAVFLSKTEKDSPFTTLNNFQHACSVLSKYIRLNQIDVEAKLQTLSTRTDELAKKLTALGKLNSENINCLEDIQPRPSLHLANFRKELCRTMTAFHV